jgi:hypothetical protein
MDTQAYVMWPIALRLWWRFYWRLYLSSVIIGYNSLEYCRVVFGRSLEQPYRDVLILGISLFCSYGSLRLLIGRLAREASADDGASVTKLGTTMQERDVKALWWSYYWRYFCISAVLFGALQLLWHGLVSVFSDPSHPWRIAMSYLAELPATLIAFKLAMERHFARVRPLLILQPNE